MKKWPNKILITSEAGFKRFKQDAIEYIEANDVICAPIKTPNSYPCLVVGNTFSWEENDGHCHWKEQKLCLTYISYRFQLIMETKELKIQIPEGYEIDKENSTFEKIVFKKKDTKPRSWEEYCDLQIINNKKGYCINDLTSKINEVHWDCCVDADSWRNVLPSIELAKASRAMQQLMSIRQEWIGDWRPVWGGSVYQYCIVIYDGGMYVDTFTICQHPLSFPTEVMAKEFLECFKDLLEIAKPLI